MPQSADEITEAITQIEQRLKARGLSDLPEDTVRALTEVISTHGLQAIGTDYDMIADQVMQAMQSSVEGGFVNDRSGQATAQVQQQYGLGQVGGRPNGLP